MIPVAKPWLADAEAQAATEAVLSGWVTQGPRVAAFEAEFARQVGAADACAVANCTVALHLVMTAMGIGPGDEVITVSHSFIATANAIRQTGATPVFVDVDDATGNMDPQQVAAALTPRSKALLVVHQVGMPCDLAALLPLAEQHGLLLIEDAACAIGSEILWQGQWERIGRPHGHAACFSFHPRKVVTTGDGGMITTRDPALLARCRLLRQHAMSVPDTVRHAASQVVFEHYPEVGFNYRMTDIQAAIGLAQLQRLTAIIERRRALAACYRTQLEAAGWGQLLPVEPAWARSNWQSFCIRLPEQTDQRVFMQAMLDAGIATRRGVMCIHRELPYQQPGGALPVSEAIQDHGVILPLYHQLTEDEVALIVRAIVTNLQEVS